jgi:hypothetical protein
MHAVSPPRLTDCQGILYRRARWLPIGIFTGTTPVTVSKAATIETTPGSRHVRHVEIYFTPAAVTAIGIFPE